jgi:F0F1-type ATP synthase beta subunit
MLDPRVVGEEHYELARKTQKILQVFSMGGDRQHRRR